MKLPLTVTLTDREPFTVAAGPKAISAAEMKYKFRVSDGSVAIEQLAFMAWSQSVTDGQFLGPWTEFWDALDDLDVGDNSTPDPT